MSLVPNEYIANLSGLSHKAFQQFYSPNPREKVPATSLFLAHYRVFPCIFTCSKPGLNALYHVSSVLNYLNKEFGHDLKNDIISQKYHTKSKQFFNYYRLCNLGNGIMIYFHSIQVKSDIENPNKFSPDILEDYFTVVSSIKIFYLPENDCKVKSMVQEFLKFFILESQYLKFSLICRPPHGNYSMRAAQIRKPTIFDLGLHYGQNFLTVHEKILKECKKKEGKGIVLLHGIPGSGKTHYIRYLIEEIRDKKLIYVPPDMAKDISKPEFLSFLLLRANGILIIEDAENIIRDRNSTTIDTSQVVANLLNLSDGLLGDAMHMQIIATFNCGLTNIDKALLRKGRLIAEYEFGKLSVDNAKQLSDRLGFGMEHISSPMTLAEIYNQNKEEDGDFIVQ